MKTSQVVAVLASSAGANAQWWGGAAGCAASCMTSYWNNPTDWPSAAAICATATPTVAACISSACGATPTAWASFSSVSSSLCSQYSSCTASGGASAVRTLTAGADGGWGGPGGHGGGWWGYGPPDGDKWKSSMSNGFWNGNSKRDWPATYTSGQVYTVTGCDWNGASGWGWGGQGPFGWGAGWTAVATSTATVTRTGVSGASTFTTTGPVTIGVVVSGSVTSTATLGFVNAAATTGNAAPGGRSNAAGVKAMGAMLGGVVGVAALL